MNPLLSPLNNNRGVALMVALFAMIFMLFMATQISYESQVSYVSSAHELRKLKAFYAAKAGTDLSLFRVALYQQVREKFDSQIKSNPEAQYMLDQVWKMPFSWPPVVPDDASSFTKDDVGGVVEESFMDAQYLTTIQVEDGKIDLNDLGSPIKELSDNAKESLLRIFQNKMDSDEAFAEKYRSTEFPQIVNNIADWVDKDKEGRNSSDESGGYDKPSDAKIELPPNRGFRTLDELHMVEGMTDEFYELLKDQVTIYGIKGINPNEAPRKVLLSLDPEMTDEMVTAVFERRSSMEKGGPFRDQQDFYNFLSSEGLRTEDLEKKNIPMWFSAAHNFRITSTGKSGNLRREITAITFDFDNIAQNYKSSLDKYCETAQDDPDCSYLQNSGPTPTPAEGGGSAQATPTPTPVKYKAPKGRPRVVFWEES